MGGGGGLILFFLKRCLPLFVYSINPYNFFFFCLFVLDQLQKKTCNITFYVNKNNQKPNINFIFFSI